MLLAKSPCNTTKLYQQVANMRYAVKKSGSIETLGFSKSVQNIFFVLNPILCLLEYLVFNYINTASNMETYS
jgi:hypothetical protein